MSEDIVPPPATHRTVPCVFTLKDEPNDQLRRYARELTKDRAVNVAIFVDGPKDCKGLKTLIEILKEAGTNVLEDDIYYVNGGPAIFGSKKITLEERTEIVRWAEGVVAKVSA